MKDKIRATDFKVSELPSTRWGLLKDSYLHQWRIILSGSLLLALFILPLICLYFVLSNLIGALDPSAVNYHQSVFSLFFYLGLALIPFTMILYVGLSGSFSLAKRLSFLEGTLTTSDFFRGLKANWRRALIMGLIVGIALYGAGIGSLYLLLFVSSSPWIIGFGIGVLIFIAMVSVSAGHYFLLEECIYDNPLSASIKNAFLFTFMRLPINALFVLLSPGIFIALMLINSITAYIGMALSIFLSLAFILPFVIYANSLFDKFINREHYPELFRKGLYTKEDTLCPK